LRRGGVNVDIFGMWGSFIEAFLGEVLSLVKVWSLVIWTLTLTAVYVANLRAARSLTDTFTLLNMLGAHRNELISLALLRLLILSFLSWLLGWSVGLAAAQMTFRLAAYAFGGPYAIPTLTAEDLARLLLWTLTAVFAGGTWPLLTSLRRLKP